MKLFIAVEREAGITAIQGRPPPAPLWFALRLRSDDGIVGEILAVYARCPGQTPCTACRWADPGGLVDEIERDLVRRGHEVRRVSTAKPGGLRAWLDVLEADPERRAMTMDRS